MKTSVAPGQVLDLTAPGGGVVSGRAYLIGSLLVVATETKAATLTFRALTKGTVTHAKADGEAWTEALKVYWDDTAKVFTSSASGNTLVGVALGPIFTVSVTLATNADPSDLLIAGLTLQVLDFAALAGATVTVTIAGVATVLTEGVDWDAVTDDETTAANLAAAIDALAGVSATSGITDTVTVTAGTGVTPTDPATGRVRLDGVAR